MAIQTEEIIKKVRNTVIVDGYAFDEDDKQNKHLIYKINKNKHEIEFFPYWKGSMFFSKLVIKGFENIPEIFKKTGHSKNKILDYVNRTFKERKIQSITVTKEGVTKVARKGKSRYLYIKYSDLVSLCDEIGSMNWLHSTGKTIFANNFFHNKIPSVVKSKSSSGAKSEIKKSLNILSKYSADKFEKNNVEQIISIISDLMRSQHRSGIEQSKLFKETRVKFDTITLDQIITDFENKLKKSVSESDWGHFLENNLVLIDSKYIHPIPQLNLMLAGTRKVDFGLVDLLGYLDIFEIKKPETKLLNANKDSRGNFSWHKESLESIVQAEKYLFHADGKRTNLKEDIKREKDIELEVIRPRAFVIMGNSNQLDSDSKKEDFRILRNQFKNIEIILYDEMLERIKNQRKSLSK